MADFTIKRNDLLPELVLTITADGVAVNLTGFTPVFNMVLVKNGKRVAPAKVARGAMTILDAPAGKVKYSWVSGNTNTAGDYLAEVEIGTPGGPFTSPNTSYISISIVEDLG